MVALAHRKIDCSAPTRPAKLLSTKSSGPLKASPPTRPKSTLPRRLTPPNTPPPARFLLPTSRPPSPPSSISPSVQLANDAKVMLAMLDVIPRPAGDDAKEAVGEALVAFAKFCEVLVAYSTPGFDKDTLVKLIDGEASLPTSLRPLSIHSASTSSEEDELPALLVLPTLLHGTSVAALLEIDESAYRERCLSGFGRAEASEGVVVRAVLARLDEVGGSGVPEWVKAWMKTRAED
ncbi:hypothetical protein BN14_10398 [Rhizoctonia solani AG-1 IB]|uniref:Uncharacterized protein n=1 Tax=Thanatephorus cucumeris (strain AG1-IB / isolate 7/3/14) TaxID=1108050 RepID=M5CGK3_THACB|nr:hypothetical protein BN14_10398 [Rhizoctonia solani AG-1 IB]